MNKMLISIFTLVALLGTSCSEIEDGVTDIDSWGNNQIDIYVPESFEHPGILHTRADLTRLKDIVERKSGAAYQGYNVFITDARSESDYVMRGPYEEIHRGNYNGSTIQSNYENDWNAAYQNAVMYCVTGDEAHARKASEIINAYASRTKAIVGNDQPLLAGIMSVKLAYACEVMHYMYPKGVSDADFEKVKSMFRKVFVPVLETFISTPAYSNGNWGASVGMACTAAGILLDDKDLYRKGIEFYLTGRDNGTIVNYIDDNGQCQESGRDQAHAQLGIACLSVTCELAHKQGMNLYSLYDNRLMKGFEYMSAYMCGKDVPFKQWKDVTGKYNNWSVISPDGRGNFRPVYQMVYNHYVNREHLSMPETEAALRKIAVEGYYYEHFGFGTFLFNEAN